MSSELKIEQDCIEELEQAVIQHGPENDRIYLMKIKPVEDPTALIHRLDQLAEEKSYGKIFAKAPAPLSKSFCSHGYKVEARVPGFYQGETEAVFLAKYLNRDREKIENDQLIRSVLSVSQSKLNETSDRLPEGYCLKELGPDDATEMAQVYDEVFPSYPFPIQDPEYLKEVLQDFVRSFGVFNDGGELVSLAACEMDRKVGSVEMTDFATRGDHRGKGLAHHLLQHMEVAMAEDSMKTAFTIARAASYGMNITFSKAGYDYSGTLKNNTNISGSIESMNVWYKPLTKSL